MTHLYISKFVYILVFDNNYRKIKNKLSVFANFWQWFYSLHFNCLVLAFVGSVWISLYLALSLQRCVVFHRLFYISHNSQQSALMYYYFTLPALTHLIVTFVYSSSILKKDIKQNCINNVHGSINTHLIASPGPIIQKTHK